MKRKSKGQIAVVLTLVAPILLGAIALCADVGVLYYNWVVLQKAADAAVLGGASYLPDNPTQAVTTTNQLVTQNKVKSSEIVSTTVASDDSSITLKLKRTVPYYFARVIGLNDGTVSVVAEAGTPYAPTTVNASTPQQVPPGGDNNGQNGSTCANVGDCGLMPIGLDWNTKYSDGQQIDLQQGQLGPGNWDLIALGAPGGNVVEKNIANGYNSMISVGDWINSEPGQKVGPVDAGFQARLNAAQSVDPNGTFSSHTLNDPRVLIVPVVDWESPNGMQAVEVKGFATLWLDSYAGGKVTVHFINQLIPNSFGDPNAPSTFGGKGWPILMK